MAAFHPAQIAHARQSLARLPGDPTDSAARISRAINWVILRNSRPVVAHPEGRIIAFRAPGEVVR